MKSFKQWLNEATNVLYHGTASTRIPSIKQSGLEPRSEKRTEYAPDNSPHVYATKNPQAASTIAHFTTTGWNDNPGEGPKAKPALLAIKRAAFKGARTDKEFEGHTNVHTRHSFFIDKKVDPSNVSVIRNKHVPKVLTAYYGHSLKKDKYSEKGLHMHNALEQNGWKVHQIYYNGAQYKNEKQYPGHSIRTVNKPTFSSDGGEFRHDVPGHNKDAKPITASYGKHHEIHNYLSNKKNFKD